MALPMPDIMAVPMLDLVGVPQFHAIDQQQTFATSSSAGMIFYLSGISSCLRLSSASFTVCITAEVSSSQLLPGPSQFAQG